MKGGRSCGEETAVSDARSHGAGKAPGAGKNAHLFLYHILPVDAEEEPVLHDLLGIAGTSAKPEQRQLSPTTQRPAWQVLGARLKAKAGISQSLRFLHSP